MDSSIIIINYCVIIIIINAYYKYVINAPQNYYISNKGLFEEWDKEKVEVTVAAITSCSKEDRRTFCPMSRIRPVTARPAPQW